MAICKTNVTPVITRPTVIQSNNKTTSVPEPNINETITQPCPPVTTHNTCNTQNIPVNQTNVLTQPIMNTYSTQPPYPYFPYHIPRLCLPEPGEFDGEVLAFPAWKNAFNSLIVQAGATPTESLHYLKKYPKGRALKCVQRYFLFENPIAFKEAMSALSDRYGDHFIIGMLFVKNWKHDP